MIRWWNGWNVLGVIGVVFQSRTPPMTRARLALVAGLYGAVPPVHLLRGFVYPPLPAKAKRPLIAGGVSLSAGYQPPLLLLQAVIRI